MSRKAVTNNLAKISGGHDSHPKDDARISWQPTMVRIFVRLWPAVLKGASFSGANLDHDPGRGPELRGHGPAVDDVLAEGRHEISRRAHFGLSLQRS